MKYINVILFLAVIFTGLSSYILKMKWPTKISYEEKRRLAAYPEFDTDSVNIVHDGSFASKYVKYTESFDKYAADIDEFMDDQFQLRNEFISIADIIRQYKGLELKSKEGKIFKPKRKTNLPDQKNSDPNKVIPPEFLDEFQEQYSGDLLILDGAVYALNGGSKAMSKKYAGMVSEYAEKLKGKARVFSCVAPLSSAFIPVQKYRKYNGLQQATLYAIRANLTNGAIFSDVIGEMNNHGNEKMYFGTDHHWNALGAYYGYVAFCKSAGLTPVPLEKMDKRTKYGFLGSMYQHTRDLSVKEHPDTFTYYIPKVAATGLIYNSNNFNNPRKCKLFYHTSSGGNMYSTFIGGDNPLTKFTTTTKNGKKCVVVKNSYGNAFTVYLVSHYEEIYVVDLRYSNHNLIELIEDNKINDLIFAIGMYGAMGNGSISLMKRLATNKGGGNPISNVPVQSADTIPNPVIKPEEQDSTSTP